MSDKYNGYTNYETFLVAIYLENDQEEFIKISQSFDNDKRKLADAIRKEHYDTFNNPPLKSPIVTSLFIAASEKVDWIDIADTIINWND